MSEIELTGAQLVGVSYDSVEKLRKASAKLKVTFPLLSDAGSKTIDAYRLRNQEYAGDRWDGVPHPMTLIITSDGIVRDRLFHEGYRKRHTGEDLINALKKLQEKKERR